MQFPIPKFSLIVLSLDQSIIFVEDVHIEVETHHNRAVYLRNQLYSEVGVEISVFDWNGYGDFQLPKTLIKGTIEHRTLEE